MDPSIQGSLRSWRLPSFGCKSGQKSREKAQKKVFVRFGGGSTAVAEGRAAVAVAKGPPVYVLFEAVLLSRLHGGLVLRSALVAAPPDDQVIVWEFGQEPHTLLAFFSFFSSVF